MAQPTSYTCTLDADKIAQLKRDLKMRHFEFRDVPYAHFGASSRGEKVSVTAYQNGKVVIQGKGLADFVQFYLEPQLLGEVKFGYENILDPSRLEPRIGVDESGKGDFFGPMVVAGVFVNADTAQELMDLGVRDSKNISSDARIFELARGIRKTVKNLYDVVTIGPEAYNRLRAKMGNVNSLLGWGHARVIENLLGKVDAPKAISDQFGNKRIVQDALMARGKKIKLEQRHKAESDVAVAAASILAREMFLRGLKKLSDEYEIALPRGASAAVEEAAREFVGKHGKNALGKVAKLHFKTAQKAGA
jgi:ribonuclease HIII